MAQCRRRPGWGMGVIQQGGADVVAARRAFVVLPANAALIALQYADLFEQRHVGLVVISPWGLQVLIEAPRREGALLMAWVHDRALAHFDTNDADQLDDRSRVGAREG